MPKERVRLSRADKRVRLQRKIKIWKPRWEPEIRGWAYNYIRQNRWRCEYTHDMADLMQDAYLVFMKVKDAYPAVVEAPHFMSLYKTSLRNAIFDKARELERKYECINDQATVEDDYKFSILGAVYGVTYNEGEILAVLENDVPEIRLLMEFLKDDENLALLREPQRTAKYEPRMTFDERLSKLLGIETFPFRERLKYLLS